MLLFSLAACTWIDDATLAARLARNEDAPCAPTAETWYDGVDQDCAGDDDYDQDADGYPNDTDCDDTDTAVYPGADDDWYDGVDADCAGNDDFDQDEDGYDSDEDCDDLDPTAYPGAVEGCDGIDHDCDGEVDPDGSISIDGVGPARSIGAALDEAARGARITICPGTYSVSETISRDVTLRASGAASETILEASGTNPIFVVNGGDALRLEDLTLTGGAGYYDGSSRFGGAIFLHESAEAELVGVVLTNNAAEVSGGAIYVSDYASLTTTDCLFTENAATYGGAIFVGSEGEFFAETTTIQANEASSSGGGVFIDGSAYASSDVRSGSAGMTPPTHSAET